MAKDSFKVKKSLNIKPTDPTTLTNREAGDIIVDSTDNNKLKTYNPTSDSYQSVSTPGGLDTVFVENFESNTASSFTSGQSVNPDAIGTGTLGGALDNETVNQLSGERSLKYTMNATAASSDNDFFLNDTDIVLDEKQKGNLLGINFYYTYNGNDDDIRFFILDQDDVEITLRNVHLKAKSTATRLSATVLIPSTTTAIRYGFQVESGNASKVLIVDDIEFSTDPLVYKDVSAATEWVDAGATSIEATTTNPTKPTVVNVDVVRWRRVGDSMELNMTYYSDSQSGAATGSGDYLFKLPTGYEMDASKLNFDTSVDGLSGYVVLGTKVGTAHFSDSSNSFEGIVYPYDTTSLKISGAYVSPGGQGRGTVSSGMYALTSADSFNIRAVVPIKGWDAYSKHVVVDSGEASLGYYKADAHAGYGSTATKIPYFTNVRSNQNLDNLVTVTNDATNGFAITALKDVEINATFWTNGNTISSITVGWSVDASVTTNFTSLTEDKVISEDNQRTINNATQTPYVTANIRLNAGQVLRPHTNAHAISDNAQTGVHFNVKKADLGEYHLVPVTDQENVFSARFSGSAGASVSVISESSPFSSVSRTTTGVFVVNYSSLGLTTIPALTAIPEISNLAQFTAHVDAISATQATIRIGFDNGTEFDTDFSIILQKQGADYKEPKAFIGNVAPIQTAYLKDVKPSGTNGADATAGAWRVRDLNTLSGDTFFVSLSSNRFTLSEGKYEIEIEAPAYDVGRHQAKLVQDPAGTPSDVLIGSSMYCDIGGNVQNNSTIKGTLNLTSSQTFEIQHQVQTTRGAGFGIASGASFTVAEEVYTTVKITKVK